MYQRNKNKSVVEYKINLAYIKNTACPARYRTVASRKAAPDKNHSSKT